MEGPSRLAAFPRRGDGELFPTVFPAATDKETTKKSELLSTIRKMQLIFSALRHIFMSSTVAAPLPPRNDRQPH